MVYIFLSNLFNSLDFFWISLNSKWILNFFFVCFFFLRFFNWIWVGFLSKFGRFLKGQLLLVSVSLWFLVIIYSLNSFQFLSIPLNDFEIFWSPWIPVYNKMSNLAEFLFTDLPPLLESRIPIWEALREKKCCWNNFYYCWNKYNWNIEKHMYMIYRCQK